MGASSAKLFDDDLAADIRELFQELLQRGETAASATQALLQNFDDIIDTEEETVFWLALAAVQWEYASLQPNVRNRALKIIANGTDLAAGLKCIQGKGIVNSISLKEGEAQ